MISEVFFSEIFVRVKDINLVVDGFSSVVVVIGNDDNMDIGIFVFLNWVSNFGMRRI